MPNTKNPNTAIIITVSVAKPLNSFVSLSFRKQTIFLKWNSVHTSYIIPETLF